MAKTAARKPTTRGVEGGYLMECHVCEATELIETPISVNEFVAKTKRFCREHRHPAPDTAPAGEVGNG